MMVNREETGAEAQAQEMLEKKGTKGVALRLMGVVALSLGFLNTMLALKGGYEMDWFHYTLIGAGALSLIVGTWQKRA